MRGTSTKQQQQKAERNSVDVFISRAKGAKNLSRVTISLSKEWGMPLVRGWHFFTKHNRGTRQSRRGKLLLVTPNPKNTSRSIYQAQSLEEVLNTTEQWPKNQIKLIFKKAAKS